MSVRSGRPRLALALALAAQLAAFAPPSSAAPSGSASARAAGKLHGGTVESQLKEAERAYERSDFKRTIDLLRPLLYPRIVMSKTDDVLRAYKLLGISYVFERQPEAAERQFLAILSLDPRHGMDPVVDPQTAVDLFEDVKRKNAEKVRAILDRARRDSASGTNGRTSLSTTERARPPSPQIRTQTVVVERILRTRAYWLNFVPLGAGQFQNGHRTKGIALLTSQLSLGAVSLTAATWSSAAYPSGRVPGAEYDQAKALNIVQVVSGALCLAAAVYGVVDALVYYRPSSVTTRTTTTTETRKGNVTHDGPADNASVALPVAPGISF